MLNPCLGFTSMLIFWYLKSLDPFYGTGGLWLNLKRKKVKKMEKVKEKKVVENPRLSLSQFAKYCAATDNSKRSIILKAKFTGGYIPKFYDRARASVREILSANMNDNDLCFEILQRKALELKAEAKEFPVKKDDYKNREYSAEGLLALKRSSRVLEPILDKFILNIPPPKSLNNTNTITIEDVKISSKVDLLLFEDAGLTEVGFISFNFTKRKLKRQEAEFWLYVLWYYHKLKGNVYNLSKCFLVDVYAGKIYTAIDERFMEQTTRKLCLEIASNWKIA